MSQVLVKQIKTLDQVQQTCVSIPDLVSKAQEDANRSKQILQLLSTLPNYQAGLDRISKGVESLEKIANGMRVLVLEYSCYETLSITIETVFSVITAIAGVMHNFLSSY